MDSIKPPSSATEIKATTQIASAQKTAAKAPTDHDQAKKAATDFEALLLHQMLNSMWATVPKDGMLGGSNEEAQYRDMYTEALARDIAEKRGLGISEVILKDFEKNKGAHK